MHTAKAFKPYRPRLIAAINWLGRLLQRVGWYRHFDTAQLMAAARKKTGLDDFGDAAIQPALQQLLSSLEQEARLHPFGRWVMRRRLLDALVVRLKAQALLAAHPEIGQQDITAPLVIVGLQRTGTTLLHRLLAADPDTRALASWEAINPIPPAGITPGQPDPRIRAAVTAEKGLRYLAPDFFAIHPVEARAPEEDVLLTEYSFMSAVPEAMARVPSYARWLREQDARPVYVLLKALLQLLQWQRPGKRWVLKTPDHLGHLDVLLQVFPDAKIIYTHRDPVRTTASFSSMLVHGYGVFSDTVDAAEVARHWQQRNVSAVNKALQVREQHPDAFIDVSYYELVEDPMQQVQRIYEFAGIELTPKARAAMEASRQTNRKDRHGVHHYRLADFGLNAEQVRRDYAPYCQRFNIQPEGESA